MAAPNSNVDPELLAKLEAQGFLDPNSASSRANPFQLPGRSGGRGLEDSSNLVQAGPPLPPGAPAPTPPPNQGPLTPTEQMLSGKLQQAGVPTTMPPEQRPGAAPAAATPQKAQGVFNAPEGGAAQKSGWAPTFGGARAVPAHSVALTSPEVSEEYNMALGRLEAAPRQLAAAEQGAAEAQAAGYDARARQLGEYDANMAVQRRRRTEALDAQMNDYKRLADEASKQQIDPNKWWNDKNDAEKVFGMIGILFSGLGGGKNGNAALDMFNKMTDRSIAAQKENIAQKGKKSEAALNIYHQKLRQFGDEDAADAATRAQMLQQFDLQTKAEALRSGSPVLEAKAEQQSAQIALELAKIHQGLEKWQQGGMVGGPSADDQKRAFELVKAGKVNPKTGQPLTPNEALQIVMALRGAAPSEFGAGKEGGGGGKPDKHDIAAAELVESGEKPVEALGVGDRITAGLADIPGLGVFFRGTEGAKKARALKATNLASLGYAHAGVGIRNYEDMVHAAEPLLIQPSDTDTVIKQKLAIRKQLGTRMQEALSKADRKRGGGSEGSEGEGEEGF